MTSFQDTDGSVEARPCDVESMLNWKLPETDLVIEGTHLGRGKSYYDPEVNFFLFFIAKKIVSTGFLFT